MKPRVRGTVVAVILATLPFQTHADWIGDFYNSAGAGVNVTAPQAIASQSVVGYSGGGMSWRVPNKNFQPIAITPPSISAGCGGIDLYLGSYSFPNKDAFVQALRNYGQAAVGYFFQLALKTMAPEIESTLAEINSIAQMVNSQSMSSCAAAKKSVDFLANALYEATAEDTAGNYQVEGKSPDHFGAKLDVQTQGYWDTVRDRYEQITGKSRSSQTDADAGKNLPPEVNLLRWALDNAHGVDMTTAEKDLIMSLVGPTLIIRTANDKDGEPAADTEALSATLNAKDISGLSNDPSSPVTLKVLVCDTQALCLNPSESTESFKPFNTRLQEVVNKLRENIQTRTAVTFTPAQELVVKLTSIPIFKAASMAETGGVAGGVANGMLPDLVNYAAMDASMRFVNYYLNIAEKSLASAGKKVPQLYQSEVVRMETRIHNLKIDMDTESRNYYESGGKPFEKLDALEKAERYMYSNLNAQLAANARFGKR